MPRAQRGTILFRGEATACFLLPPARRGGSPLLSANELAEAIGGRLIETSRAPGRYDLVTPSRGRARHVVRFHRGRTSLMVDWVLHFTRDAPVVHDENVYVSVDFARVLVTRLLREETRFDASRRRLRIGRRPAPARERAARRATAAPAAAAVRPLRPASGAGILRPLSDWWRDRIERSHGAAWRDGGKVTLVCLDPGHGGRDGGAVGPSGLREKDASLGIALKVRDRLRERLPALRVVMTRADDRYVRLEERARIANEAGADLFLSIHMNASRSRHAHGTEVYRYSPRSLGIEAERFENQGAPAESGAGLDLVLAGLSEATKDRFSVELGGLVKQGLVESLDYGLSDRRDRIEAARLHVLARARMPAVLVEVAFISNPREEKLLRTAAFHVQAADALCRAIEAYKESIEGRLPVVVEATGEAGRAHAAAAPEGVSVAAVLDLPDLDS